MSLLHVGLLLWDQIQIYQETSCGWSIFMSITVQFLARTSYNQSLLALTRLEFSDDFHQRPVQAITDQWDLSSRLSSTWRTVCLSSTITVFELSSDRCTRITNWGERQDMTTVTYVCTSFGACKHFSLISGFHRDLCFVPFYWGLGLLKALQAKTHLSSEWKQQQHQLLTTRLNE